MLLHSSVPAVLQICPCAATAAAHARAVLGVLPFTNKASTEPCALHHLPPPLPGCCSHFAHPHSPAESTPHPVLHTTPTQGSRPWQHHNRAWSSSWLYPPVPRPGHAAAFQGWLEPGCPAGTQSCHLHPPQTHQSRLGQPDRLTCSLPFKFSCALGNRSRLDPVCSRRNRPGMEECSQQMGRAMKGKDSSS